MELAKILPLPPGLYEAAEKACKARSITLAARFGCIVLEQHTEPRPSGSGRRSNFRPGAK